jgi:Fe-S cluster assembly iron-binding protein IscA
MRVSGQCCCTRSRRAENDIDSLLQMQETWYLMFRTTNSLGPAGTWGWLDYLGSRDPGRDTIADRLCRSSAAGPRGKSLAMEWCGCITSSASLQCEQRSTAASRPTLHDSGEDPDIATASDGAAIRIANNSRRYLLFERCSIDYSKAYSGEQAQSENGLPDMQNPQGMQSPLEHSCLAYPSIRSNVTRPNLPVLNAAVLGVSVMAIPRNLRPGVKVAPVLSDCQSQPED